MAIPTGNVRKVVSEAKRISGAVGPGVVACRSSATCESFRRNAPSATLIHLATHAIFRADNPMFSGIRLSDGWLVARDLYDMRLDCDLVSLSACNTGVNEPAPGDELFGLCRGFLAAGARNMAVSLWAADDRATEDLMVRFYKGLSRGLGAAESLRRAQLEVRKRFAHPYFWAHFALVGGS
jgi:CHAT domain-containing protein